MYTFFNAETHPLIDVGGDGDCGFRSIAACLIDQPHWLSPSKLKLLLKGYKKYVLQNKGEPPSKINDLPVENLIPNLAVVLRQLAVKTMCKHSPAYSGAFIHSTEDRDTSVEEMRKPKTWIDESAIAALANYLEVPIKVEVMHNEGKYCLHYGPKNTSKLPSWTIQLKNQHYRPRIKNVAYIKSAMAEPTVPLALPIEDNPSMAEILAEIAAEDQRLITQFEKTKKSLTNLVLDGQITKEDLLDLYIKGLGDSDYLLGRIKYVGTEYGNQDFFTKVIQRVQKGESHVTQAEKMHEADIIKETIHAISRAISIGQMDEEKIFSYIEDRPTHMRKLRG